MYEYTVWLEIHVKLNSKTKLFCKCKNDQEFDNISSNENICPVCTGQPWALPVLSQEPFEKAVMLWLALNCKIANESYFDRKSYFYPDLPLWYQITQLNAPTNEEWYVNFFTENYNQENSVRIERAHIESDAWKTIHEWGKAMLDFNRAGTPLVEIVTYPDFESDDQVVDFLKELQRLVRFNNIWFADMEKWQLRVDVNISTRKKGDDQLWTKVELKNMNSFWAIKRAINNEFERQKQILESGEEIQQQTRWWDDDLWESYLMRSKEDALDYRYFPEPDMPPVYITENEIWKIKQTLVEPTFSKIKRYTKDYGFNKEYVNALIQNTDINFYFEDIVNNWIQPKLAAKWIVTELLWFMSNDIQYLTDFKFGKKQFFDFLELIQNWQLMDSHGKQVLKEMVNTGKNPTQIIEEKWLKPMNLDDIEWFVDEVLAENPQAVEDIKNWEQKAIGFLVWQVMKKSQWKAEPKQVNKLIQDKTSK